MEINVHRVAQDSISQIAFSSRECHQLARSQNILLYLLVLVDEMTKGEDVPLLCYSLNWDEAVYLSRLLCLSPEEY